MSAKRPIAQKATIEPLNCYLQGKDFLGHEYWSFWAICFVGLFIGGIFPIILIGACWCGIMKCFLNRSYNKPVSFNTLFEGFEHFTDGLIAGACWFGCAMVFGILYMVTMFAGIGLVSIGEPLTAVMGGLLIAVGYALILIGTSIMNIGLVFSTGLIVEHRMSGFEAFKLSFEGMMANFWGLLGASLIGGLIQLVAFMMCIIPGILVIPMIAAGHYLCYRKIFVGQAGAGIPVPPVKAANGGAPTTVYGTIKP